MKTAFVDPKSADRKWYLIDAKDKVLGRLASEAAKILSGKNKASYSPSHDLGDRLVIVNANHVTLTGRKAETKTYFSHSTYPGGGRELSYSQLREKDPAAPVTKAIKGMLPKNARGRAILKKLFVYGEEIHPHQAQKPEPIHI